MSNKVRLVLLVLGLGLLVLAGVRVRDALLRREATSAGGPSAAVPVEVLALAPRDLVDQVEATGTLRARNDVDVVADLPGRVREVRVDVGSVVAEGEVLARLEAEDMALAVQQAEAGLAMARAGLETAAADLAAAEPLAEAGGVSQTQIIALRARKASAEAQVRQAEAGVAMARSRLGDTSIRSPIAGVVTRNLTRKGRMASPGYPLFTVQDQAAFELALAMDERAAALVRPGQAAQITVGGQTLAGQVRTVASALDPNTRKAEVVLELPAPGEGVLANSTATARISLGVASGVLAVPDEAVLGSGEDAVVFVVEQGKARRVPVRTGAREQGWTEVIGVEAGAQVVISGQHLLTDGAAVAAAGGAPGQEAP